MSIRVFNANDTIFLTEGNRVLRPMSCIETKQTDGDWFITVELGLEYVNNIQQDSIIVVPTKYGPQPFRAGNINISNIIESTANHIGFDSKNFIIDAMTITGTAQQILDALIGSASTNHFTAYSDIAGIKTVTFELGMLYNDLLVLQTAFGGYLDFDVWQIRLTSTLGADRGVVVEYGKNLEGAEVNEDWSMVCTEIYPVGKNGITLTPKTLFSAIQYDRPYPKVVDIDTEDLTVLNNLALAYLSRFDTPKVNYKVTSTLQNVYSNDEVQIKSTQYTLMGNVLLYTYDNIVGLNLSVELGNYVRTTQNAYSTINDMMNDIDQKVIAVGNITQQQTELINAAGDYGYCTKTANEMYFHDAVPLSESVNVFRINVAGAGFSHTGVNGPYISAWTLDGKINADLIQAGILTGREINNGSGTFRVTEDGEVTASNATITGDITATSGKIGRLDITDDDIYYVSDEFAKQYDNNDLDRLRRILSGLETQTNYDLYVYDLNNSGTITTTDLVLVRRIVTGLDPNPNKMIKSVITIGKTTGEILVTSISSIGNYASPNSFAMWGDRLIGDMAKIKSADIINLALAGYETFYSEGTFSPVVFGTISAGVGTYSAQNGHYTRIGNVVAFTLYVQVDAHTGTGDMQISGLPFVAKFHNPVTVGFPYALARTYAFIVARIPTNQSVIVLESSTGPGALIAITMDSVFGLMLSGSYLV